MGAEKLNSKQMLLGILSDVVSVLPAHHRYITIHIKTNAKVAKDISLKNILTTDDTSVMNRFFALKGLAVS